MTGADEWARWQRAHAAALQTLQDAQRAYHRTLGTGALDSAHGPSNDSRKNALLAVDLARIRLDEIRARQPQSGPRRRRG
jgi:hypothetical protein